MVAEPGGPQERGRPRLAQHIVDVLVPLITEEIVEIVKVVFQERIAEKICEQIVDVDGCRIKKRPRPQAETEPCNMQWNKFPMFLVPEVVTQLLESTEDHTSRQNPAADCGANG